MTLASRRACAFGREATLPQPAQIALIMSTSGIYQQTDLEHARGVTPQAPVAHALAPPGCRRRACCSRCGSGGVHVAPDSMTTTRTASKAHDM